MGEHGRRVRPQRLSEEAWSPYGWLPVADTDPKDGVHRLEFEWADPHVNVIGHTLAEVPHTPGALRCEALFRHDTHTQSIMPIDHPCVIAVAPPGTDFVAVPSTDPIEVFVIEPLESIVLHRGTWHWGPYPTRTEAVRLFNVQGLRYAEDNAMVDLAALGLCIDVDREGETVTEEPTPVLFGAASIADGYDTHLASQLFAPWAQVLVEKVGIVAGSRVLDVASGTGEVARAAARAAGPSGRVTASDISGPMLAVSAEKVRGPDSAPIEFLESSVTDLASPDSSYDVVVCQQGLQFFPDKAAAVAQMYRVLVPGGVVGIAVWSDAHPLLFDTVRTALLDAGVQEPTPGAFDNRRFTMGASELTQLVETAGFRHVVANTCELDARWASPDEAMRIVEGTPHATLLGSLSVEDQGRVRAALRARLAGDLDGAVVVPTAATIVVARR